MNVLPLKPENHIVLINAVNAIVQAHFVCTDCIVSTAILCGSSNHVSM